MCHESCAGTVSDPGSPRPPRLFDVLARNRLTGAGVRELVHAPDAATAVEHFTKAYSTDDVEVIGVFALHRNATTGRRSATRGDE